MYHPAQMPTFLFLKMNGQRSETGSDRGLADGGKGGSPLADCRCVGTAAADATEAAGTLSTRTLSDRRPCGLSLGGERVVVVGGDQTALPACQQRTGSGHRAGTEAEADRRGACRSCEGRESRRRPGVVMDGRSGAPRRDADTPDWRKVKATARRRRGPAVLGPLVSLSDGLGFTRLSSRSLSGRWMVYLFCYLIFLSSGWPLSLAYEDGRQSQASGSRTVEDLAPRNSHGRANRSDDVWAGILGDSHQVKNRVRLSRAGGKYASTNYMRMIEKESKLANCQPRDTVLDSYEELNIPKGYDSTKVFPECIVVRRCKNGGCCRDDQECAARSNGRHNVSKWFLINSKIVSLPIAEDTECECVAKPDFCSPPETDCPHDKTWSYGQCGCICRRRCPKPFLQDEATCACDCLMTNRICKNIQRGRKDLRLSTEECDCVRGGLCRVPNCVNGRFSTVKCKCVQQDNN